MNIEIKVPALPESVSDATLVSWHKNVGEAVARDENLVDLETDKVVLEVPAPAGGVIEEIRVGDGSTVEAGRCACNSFRGCGSGSRRACKSRAV